MSTDKAEAPGMVHALDARAQQQRQPVTQLPPEPCAELILHSSAVGMGVLPDDTVILSFTLPFGLRITVPFARHEWEQIRANSSRVTVATQMPVPPPTPIRKAR